MALNLVSKRTDSLGSLLEGYLENSNEHFVMLGTLVNLLESLKDSMEKIA